ncbi:tryptophan 2-C-methyltransferase [Actinacidiphila sp. ITFR-21]|uniref:tryptophan 2-C-methyltransferase n=1 Tax=Actinacidiphila sp. ITFR-21 TaxID=3075199 RepID=UPI00288C3DAF|nr:tryptophan 2-C-methyltransferase [Streptomyces sp. ITFR-21]WNI18978.1 tryptophan 2-C-methyltransferase [Streptomyces sp. ITFR-21]
MHLAPSASKGLVTLINPNFVKPGVTPYALDILCSHLEVAGFEVEVLDLTFRESDWRLAEYFATRDPLMVGITLRNAGSVQPQEQRVFLPDHLRVIDAVRALTGAPIVLGGAGFSSMPYAAMEYFRVPYGVKGPGEVVICDLADALASGRRPDSVQGLLTYDGQTVRAAGLTVGFPVAGSTLGRHISARYQRHSGVPYRIDNREYYDKGGLGNLLTKNGCPFACNHCVEPDAKGAVVSRRTPAVVVDEIESMMGQGIYDIHTTDSEFNINPMHSKEILREIIQRRGRAGSPLHRLRLWIYAHPVPFDEELADLLAEAGCKGVSLSAEHMGREDLAVWDAPSGRVGLAYTLDDVRKVTKLLSDRGIIITTELLLGLPGENLDTLKRAVDASLALPTTVVGYTLGLQVFPHAPLGIRLAAESGGDTVVRGLQSNTARSPILLKPLDRCATMTEYERQFWFDGQGRIRPVFYFSPDLPEDPATVGRPDGRWVKTIEWLQDYVPASEHYRVALPTLGGNGQDDNNYADNPFLKYAVALGYKGAYYSWWRSRERIFEEARLAGLTG